MTFPNENRIEVRKRAFIEALRLRKLKITPQRLEIFREIAASIGHPTAEEIHSRIILKMPTVSLDTVYRTLSTLQANWVISRVEVLDDRARYEANLKRHHHLVCIKCKKVEDIYWSEFDRLGHPVEANRWGNIIQSHAELRGICKSCRDEHQDLKKNDL